jgi:hypothetical protein
MTATRRRALAGAGPREKGWTLKKIAVDSKNRTTETKSGVS